MLFQIDPEWNGKFGECLQLSPPWSNITFDSGNYNQSHWMAWHNKKSIELQLKVLKLNTMYGVHTTALWAHDGDHGIRQSAFSQSHIFDKIIYPINIKCAISINHLCRATFFAHCKDAWKMLELVQLSRLHDSNMTQSLI